jgi:2,4-dienoyl-CoA reductase-like NADH-dependent reductase (Old Yellow Enzyme family)/NADH dehydrogenase FAD-containing subunit
VFGLFPFNKGGKEMTFKRMFEPGQIGTMELKNRLVCPPMVRNWATEDGEITDRLITHYAAIAAGGTGMIIVEASYTHPTGKGFVNQVGVHDDKLIPGLKRLASAVHAHGVKVGVQAHHAGRQTLPQICGCDPVAPSPIPCEVLKLADPDYVPRELTTGEVGVMADSYAEAARRIKEAGFDFVEIHGAHGYLITGFLSPLFNQRSDKYGGNFSGRMRFALEVVEKVRAQVDPDYPVTVRLIGSEFSKGGIDIAYTQRVVQELDKAGIDGFHISGGIYDSPPDQPIPPMATPPCPLVEFAAAVKEVTSKPVITVSKIYRPELVEDVLAKNQADFVATGRWLLADPEWPNKVKESRLDDINYCITCQGCNGRLDLQMDVQCTVNPWCGREKDLEMKPAPKPKKVWVIGGGPAGMEAAWVAAQRGHHVTLYEKDLRLGGQILLAAVSPTREDLNVFAQYQMRQLARTGVCVITGKEVTPDLVRAEKPDAVIIATGSSPAKPGIPGIDGTNVVDARDVLKSRAQVRDPVIVAGGGLVGCGVAEWLAERAIQVRIVEMLENIATDMSYAEMIMFLSRLEKLGVEIFTKKKITKITLDGVVVEGNGKTEKIAGESVVLAMGAQADQKLAQALKGQAAEIYTAGDCVEPRKCIEAVFEGAKVGCEV